MMDGSMSTTRDLGMEGRPASGGMSPVAKETIGTAIDRIDYALEQLQAAVETNRHRSDAVIDNTMRQGDGEKKAEQERMGSQIQQALHLRADIIERITAQLRDVNDRLDL